MDRNWAAKAIIVVYGIHKKLIISNLRVAATAIIAPFPWTRLCSGAFDLKKHKLAEGWGREEWGIANWIYFEVSKELG